METPKVVKPNYSKSHMLMLEQSQTMQGHFETDKADFAHFTQFLDPFAANWQTAIDAADALPDDEAVRDEIKLLTQTVNVAMNAAENAYGTLIIYVKQAYPNDAAILQLFGEDRHRAVQKNQLRMIELMELAAAKANTAPYKAALIAKGFLQADINMLKTIELDLRAKNKAQEGAISNRPFTTQTRQTALNATWNFALQANEAAQAVYKNDFAKQQLYLLYPENAGGGTPPVTASITITTDQTIPGALVIIDIYGTPLATGGEIRMSWEPGITESDNLLASGIIDFTHTYTTPGIKTMTLTPVTPGVFRTVEALVIASNKATAAFIPPELNNVKTLDASNNNFDAPTVNAMLLWLDNNNITGGTCNITGGTNAAPTGAGITAKNNLIAKGWAVSTN